MHSQTAVVLRRSSVLALLALAGSCRAPGGPDELPVLDYVGSSTIANFIRDAEPAYGRARFVLDTEPESAGGEVAILEGRTDLAGVARQPAQETLDRGVTASLIGEDRIAVIVHPSNPVDGLTLAQLREIFAGRANDWSELGGPERPIERFIVPPASATRKVFRSAVLEAEEYGDCEVVAVDGEMVSTVASRAGAIGHISLSFVGDMGDVKPIAVDGQIPSRTNDDYPITRPLYLLWWRGRSRVAEFVTWALSDRADEILLRRFTRTRPTAAGGE